jgi:hypothetical protein
MMKYWSAYLEREDRKHPVPCYYSAFIKIWNVCGYAIPSKNKKNYDELNLIESFYSFAGIPVQIQVSMGIITISSLSEVTMVSLILVYTFLSLFLFICWFYLDSASRVYVFFFFLQWRTQLL